MAHALKLLPPNGEEPIAPQSEAAKSAQTVTFGDLDRAIAALLALILDQQRDLVESCYRGAPANAESSGASAAGA